MPQDAADATITDATITDATITDATTADASTADASTADASTADASTADATTTDATTTDASTADATTTDATTADTGGCEGPLTRCDGVCVFLPRDIAHCGACGRRCEAPTDGTAACEGGVCRTACPAGRIEIAGRCVSPTARLVAPLSTTVVTRDRPTLRWSLASGADGAVVELCRDRACGDLVERIEARGDRTTPTAALPPGVYFWRAFPRAGSTAGASPTAVWQFVVPARSSAVADGSRGVALDVNGDGFDDLAVGAMGWATRTGAVFVFHGGAAGLGATAATTLDGVDGPGDSYFARTVGAAGDLNGDGFGDLAVAAPGANGGSGRVYVYFGASSGLPRRPSVTLDGSDGANASFGTAVGAAGDVDGDGYGDLAVGSPGGATRAGVVWIFRGGPGGPSRAAADNVPGLSPNDTFGTAVVGAGDVNRDGFADLLVGAPSAYDRRGAVTLFLGSRDGVARTAAQSFEGTDLTESLGLALAQPGDLDGDGFDDLAAGSTSERNGLGRVRILLGNGTRLRAGTVLAAPGGATVDTGFGGTLEGGRDLNGDGLDDLVVGASAAGNNTGRVHLYPGRAAGVSPDPTSTLPGRDGTFGCFGSGLALGDFARDGLPDLAVGAYCAVMNTGRVYLFPGRRDTVVGPADRRLPPAGSSFGQFGIDLAAWLPRPFPSRRRAG